MPSYQSPSMSQAAPSQNTSRYPQLDSILRTEDGFARTIVYKGAATTALSIVLFVAVLAVVWNLVNTFQSLNDQGLPVGQYFWRMFFEVRNTSGNVDPYFLITVWLPVIAIPVLLLLLVVRQLTKGGSIAKVYAQYRNGGFLAELVPTNINVYISNSSQGPVYVIGAPNIQPDWVTAAVQRLQAGALSDPKSKECKAYQKAISGAVARGFALLAVQANKADPGLPDGIFITAQARNLKSPVRIAIPAGNDFTTLKLYQLQKTAPLA